MILVRIGGKSAICPDDVQAVLALSEMTDKGMLKTALEAGKLYMVNGFAVPKTAVIMHNGSVYLTSLSAATVQERIQATMPFI